MFECGSMPYAATEEIVHMPHQPALFCSAQVESIVYRDFPIEEFASGMVLLNKCRAEK
jgi:hypothetical protein